MTYPLDTAARVARRREILRVAEARARLTARSSRCAAGDCARTDPKYGRVGCANDGTNCICECHDRAGSVAR